MTPETDGIIEGYLKNQAEIARIDAEADAAEAGVKAQMKELDDEMYRKQRELDDEKSRKNMVLNNCLVSVQNTRKHNLEPLYEQMNRVKRIIALLRIAETIQPVRDIEDGEITTYHGEYLEWLEYLYNDEFLKIRCLITENRKPKNKYSLIAYGRYAFNDQKLHNTRSVYSYGTPSLKDRDMEVRLELASCPSVQDAKTYSQKWSNKHLKQFIAEFEALKKEYLEVTGKYKLSDFEQITAQEKAKGGSQ